MPEGADLTDVVIRVLEPHEAERLTDAIRVAYGETYDAEWVYAHDVAVASEHGRGLLDYVLADLAATGQEGNGRSRSSTSAGPSSAGPPRTGCAPARERSTT